MVCPKLLAFTENSDETKAWNNLVLQVDLPSCLISPLVHVKLGLVEESHFPRTERLVSVSGVGHIVKQEEEQLALVAAVVNADRAAEYSHRLRNTHTYTLRHRHTATCKHTKHTHRC